MFSYKITGPGITMLILTTGSDRFTVRVLKEMHCIIAPILNAIFLIAPLDW